MLSNRSSAKKKYIEGLGRVRLFIIRVGGEIKRLSENERKVVGEHTDGIRVGEPRGERDLFSLGKRLDESQGLSEV
jgi:hypothetical protein